MCSVQTQTMTDEKFLINAIYPTIQGEGKMVGTAMVVVRLHGCSVGCPFCDTKETWAVKPKNEVEFNEVVSKHFDMFNQEPVISGTYARVTPDELLQYIKGNYPNHNWILLTGGEPMEQNILPLLETLARDYMIAVETSGTAEPDDVELVLTQVHHLTLSPKHYRKQVYPVWVHNANEIKFVIGAHSDILGMEFFLKQHQTDWRDVNIFIQPMSQSRKATELCVMYIQENPQVRLSIQVHKYLNLP